MKILTPLRKLKSKTNLKNVYSFDIETQNKNKDFACGSIVHLTEKPKIFLDRKEMQEYFLNFSKNGRLFIATNLEFDISALFGHNAYGNVCFKPFVPFYNDSQLLCGNIVSNHGIKIKFIDSLNFSKISVEKIGKMLNIPKMQHPDFNEGINEVNRGQWIKYNINDAFITLKFYEFLSNQIGTLDSKLKTTIASTAMNLYRRRYMKECIQRPDKEIIEEQRQGYYGGRCEVFSRGYIENYYMYDTVSMYPFVMLNKYPDPNSMQFSEKGNMNNIMDFEGLTHVKLKVDKTYYPFLPARINKKLIFPCGYIDGWFTNLEIREAYLHNEYEIIDIFEQYTYMNVCHPFKEYVEELFYFKNKYKKEGNKTMEFFYKLLLNSLYGKWAQRCNSKLLLEYIDDIDLEQLQNGEVWSKIGGYIRIESECTDKQIPAFVNPIFSIYTTAMARIHLYKFIKNNEAIYCDTDSIITPKKINYSDSLGEMNFQEFIEKGIIVKPKMYLTNEKVKLKGFSRATQEDFFKILRGESVSFDKFMKFKETLRSAKKEKYLNEIKSITKFFHCEDDKRIWKSKFSPKELQQSEPIVIENFI